MLAASIGSAMRAVVVVVDVPDSDRGGAGIFAVELSGVEQFVRRDPLVALDFSVGRGVYGLVF